MSKFKVGDKVKLKSGLSCINLNHTDTYTVRKSYADAVALVGLEYPYAEHVFMLYEESKNEGTEVMQEQKFKVGDEVVRTHPSSKLVVGEIYIIKEILSSIPAIILEGYSNMYNLDNFELAELDYKVVDTSEILTPLQVAEAILNGEEIQVEYTSSMWKDVTNKDITIPFIAINNFRLKPKTIVINGVEVPAPLDTKSLGYPDKVYGLNFSRKSVYDTTGHTNRGLFWTTEKDAQKVLDAMLTPFNKLNKGDK